MSTNLPERWNGLKNWFTTFPVVVRRFHRIVGTLWLLSLAVTLVVPAASEQLPGPSIPALSFVAVILTGTYLLLRPWVRGPTTASARLQRLTSWTWNPSVVVRRTHRIAAGLFVILLVVALSVAAAGGPESSPLLLGPVVALLAYLAITGMYMFLRPWVGRLRGG